MYLTNQTHANSKESIPDSTAEYPQHHLQPLPLPLLEFGNTHQQPQTWSAGIILRWNKGVILLEQAKYKSSGHLSSSFWFDYVFHVRARPLYGLCTRWWSQKIEFLRLMELWHIGKDCIHLVKFSMRLWLTNGLQLLR